MRNLSTGHPSNLGSYLVLTKKFFGDGSPAVKCIEDKIKKSPHGVDEEVLADEMQMVNMLLAFHKGWSVYEG